MTGWPKEPANGLAPRLEPDHQLRRRDSSWPSSAPSPTTPSVYARQNTNVAILATRRGISLKSQFAVMAGGMNYNPERSRASGWSAVAWRFRMQRTIFEGQAADSGGTAANELGLYDANAFTGLRSILNTASARELRPGDRHRRPPARSGINVDAARSADRPGGARARRSSGAIPRRRSPSTSSRTSTSAPGRTRLRQHSVLAPRPRRSTRSPAPSRSAVVPGTAINNYTATTYSSNNVRDLYMLDESTHHAAVSRVSWPDGPRDPHRHLGPAHPPVHRLHDERARGEGPPLEQQDPGQGLGPDRLGGPGRPRPGPPPSSGDTDAT